MRAATKNLDAEIIVVDNNSPDDSCSMVKAIFPEVKLIENKENFGFSKGNNIGVAAASGEYLCFLNPDTVVAEDTFETLLKFADSKENLGIVGCKLINGSGQFLPESKRNLPVIKVAVQKFMGYGKQYYAGHIDENAIHKVDVLVGAFMLMKQEVFYEIGKFDERYFMYGEDIDLSYCSLKVGYDNYYFGKTTVIHFKGESTLKNEQYAERFFSAMQFFYDKHFKRNRLFDLFIYFGIKGLYFLKNKPQTVSRKPKYYILFSEKINPKLIKILDKELILYTKKTKIEPHAQLIFDANNWSYKDIISNMEQNKVMATVKILPDDAHFILGSDNGVSRGEVLEFDKIEYNLKKSMIFS
ncbi:glycosyltransferase family 2 protein [Gaetbulibacter aestuarii]